MPQVLAPTKNRVVCTHKDSPEEINGIIIPDQYRKVPQIAVIESVGPDATEDFSPGDEVLYAKYAGMEADIEGTTYLVLDADDIVATVVQEFEGIEDGPPVININSVARDPEEVS